jgi:hypothetical protein
VAIRVAAKRSSSKLWQLCGEFIFEGISLVNERISPSNEIAISVVSLKLFGKWFLTFVSSGLSVSTLKKGTVYYA